MIVETETARNMGQRTAAEDNEERVAREGAGAAEEADRDAEGQETKAARKRDADAEARFLGSCLFLTEADSQGPLPMLRRPHLAFGTPRYRTAHRAMLNAAEAGLPLDPYTIRTALSGVLTDAEVDATCDELTQAGVLDATTAQIVRYAEAVEEAARRRELPRVLEQARKALESGKVRDMGHFVDVLQSQLGRLIVQRGEWPSPMNASQWLDQASEVEDPIIEGLLDKGDKEVLVAMSKARKTFLALHLGMHIAAGKVFLGFRIPKARRVMIAQFEIRKGQYHKRLLSASRGTGIKASDLGDRLLIHNLRRDGSTPDEKLRRIAEDAKANNIDLIIIDPFYKLIEGDENAAHDVKPILAMIDRMAEETGAAVLYVLHAAKGHSGEKQAIDRAVGSGVIARDFDSQISIGPHVEYTDERPLLVVELTTRNYPPRGAFTMSFEGGRFEVVDMAPEAQTSKNKKKTASKDLDADVLTLFVPGRCIEKYDLLRRINDPNGPVALAQRPSAVLLKSMLAKKVLFDHLVKRPDAPAKAKASIWISTSSIAPKFEECLE